jgi:hypothetical protein
MPPSVVERPAIDWPAPSTALCLRSQLSREGSGGPRDRLREKSLGSSASGQRTSVGRIGKNRRDPLELRAAEVAAPVGGSDERGQQYDERGRAFHPVS